MYLKHWKKKLAINGKQKNKTIEKKRKDHPKIIHVVVKQGSIASGQQMTRQQDGTKTQKLYKVQAWKKLMKVAGWVVEKSHSTIE
jgi:translation initiation factor IF-2